ncbi:alpha/beta hydrolase [Chloroflexota bacterium]
MSSIRSSYDPINGYEIKVWDEEYLQTKEEVLLARIYQPCGEGPFPALLDVHGGVWSGGDRTSSAFLDQSLASSGLVVVAVDFHLAPKYPYPTQIMEVNFATRWLKDHAQELNADSRNVGTLGTSSGGHTTMLSAMKPHHTSFANLPLSGTSLCDATVKWVIALWPVLDPYARYIYAQEFKRKNLVTLTEGYFINENNMQEGNPQLILDRGEEIELPPVLIIQGTADANIPLTIPKRFASSYQESGGEIDLELFPDMPHGFIGGPYPESQQALDIIKTWIFHRVETQ